MIPSFFAMNHHHYSRWLPVHLRDMCALQQTAPDVTEAFKEGLFTVRSRRMFFSMAIDQAHEKNNAMVKGEGGAVGLTENPDALCRWMLSVLRLVNLFQDSDNYIIKLQEATRSLFTKMSNSFKAIKNFLYYSRHQSCGRRECSV